VSDRQAYVERRRVELRQRALIPRDNPPNEGGAGPNDPPVSVGPTSSEGFGNTHVMYDANALAPPGVQAWSGWPVEWATPNWGSSVGIDGVMNRVSTVWTCLDKNASAIASMPVYCVEGMRPVDSPQWMENPQPEVYASWDEAIYQVMISFQLGEALLWCTSRNRDLSVRTWVMLDPNRVSCQEGVPKRWFLNGVEITEDVLHIPYASWPGDLRGHGPLEAGATQMYGALAMERYAANLAIRGGIPWGVLNAGPVELQAGQARLLQEQYVEARMSAAGAPAVLSGNLTLQPLTFNPKDMALLELRQFEESRLSTLLGVPPFLAGLPSGGDSYTYANISSLFDYHWRDGLKPRAQRVMKAISGWALPRGRRAELNRDEYIQPGIVELAQAYSVLHSIQDGEGGPRAMSVDEIRAAQRNYGLPADQVRSIRA